MTGGLITRPAETHTRNMLPTVTRNSCCRPRPAIDGIGIHRFFGSYGEACAECQQVMSLVPEGAIIDPDVGVLVVDSPDDDLQEAVLGLQAAGARGVLNTLFLQMFDVAPRVASLMPETMRAAKHVPSDRMMPGQATPTTGPNPIRCCPACATSRRNICTDRNGCAPLLCDQVAHHFAVNVGQTEITTVIAVCQLIMM